MDGLVEVKIEYGGMNFADIYMRKGLMPDKKLPYVTGMEGVGRITAVGSSSTDLKVSHRTQMNPPIKLFEHKLTVNFTNKKSKCILNI